MTEQQRAQYAQLEKALATDLNGASEFLRWVLGNNPVVMRKALAHFDPTRKWARESWSILQATIVAMHTSHRDKIAQDEMRATQNRIVNSAGNAVLDGVQKTMREAWELGGDEVTESWVRQQLEKGTMFLFEDEPEGTLPAGVIDEDLEMADVEAVLAQKEAERLAQWKRDNEIDLNQQPLEVRATLHRHFERRIIERADAENELNRLEGECQGWSEDRLVIDRLRQLLGKVPITDIPTSESAELGSW